MHAGQNSEVHNNLLVLDDDLCRVESHDLIHMRIVDSDDHVLVLMLKRQEEGSEEFISARIFIQPNCLSIFISDTQRVDGSIITAISLKI